MTNKLGRPVSLVLSCGAARGFAHIGVIEVLEENGYKIETVSGSSIGAVVGGVYAAGKLPEYKKWICSLKPTDVFKLMDFTLPSQGILKGEKVFKRMRKFIDDINIEDLPIPFTAVGTDLRLRKEIVFKKGSLYEAMRASVAVPGVFNPVLVEGREVVDGGIISPLPIAFLERKPDSLLVVSNVNGQRHTSPFKLNGQDRPKSWAEKILSSTGVSNNGVADRMKLLNIYHDSISLMSDKITQMTIEKYKPDVTVNVAKNTCGMFDFHLANDLIELGRTSCHDSLNLMNEEENKHPARIDAI